MFPWLEAVNNNLKPELPQFSALSYILNNNPFQINPKDMIVFFLKVKSQAMTDIDYGSSVQ